MRKTGCFNLLVFNFALLLRVAWASPINTDTALPVHQGEFLWREQVRFFKAADAFRDREVLAVPSVFIYGITEKLAVIGVVPYLDKTLKLGGAERGVNGLGDSTLLGRYQIWQRNRPGETFRGQLLGGLKFPTGEDGKRDGLGRLPPPPLHSKFVVAANPIAYGGRALLLGASIWNSWPKKPKGGCSAGASQAAIKRCISFCIIPRHNVVAFIGKKKKTLHSIQQELLERLILHSK